LPEAAREYLERERGAHFDPACVDALLSRWQDALEIRQRYSD
jgi:response regulator RpfG family c-di-GMP phosphodiesterase